MGKMEMGKKIILTILAFLFGFVVYEKCIVSEEARIRRGLQKAVKALQEEDLETCLSYVSIHYHDEWDLNYFNIKGLLTRIFEEFNDFEISIEDLQIRIHESKEADVFIKVRVLVTFMGKRGYILGSGQEALPIRLHYKKERRRWRVINVDGVRPSGFKEDLSRFI